MSKYGRPVDHGDSTRLVDIVEIPSDVTDADAWLRRMYAPHVDDWVAAGEWFIEAPADMPLISGAPVVNGEVLPLPALGECVVELAANAGCAQAQAVMAAEAAEKAAEVAAAEALPASP